MYHWIVARCGYLSSSLSPQLLPNLEVPSSLLLFSYSQRHCHLGGAGKWELRGAWLYHTVVVAQIGYTDQSEGDVWLTCGTVHHVVG